MEYYELKSFTCPICNNSIKGYLENNEVVCINCGNMIKVVRAIKNEYKLLNEDAGTLQEHKSLYESLTVSLQSGNYSDGLEYCNKVLTIDGDNKELLINKIVCMYYISINSLPDNPVNTSSLRDILLQIQSVKEYLNSIPANKIITDNICFNISAIIKNQIRLTQIKPIKIMPKYAEEFKNRRQELINHGISKLWLYTRVSQIRYPDYEMNRLINNIELLESCYDSMVVKDCAILKYLVEELSNQGKITWWIPQYWLQQPKFIKNPLFPALPWFRQNYNVRAKRDEYINRIKSIEPGYISPNIYVKLFPLRKFIIVSVLLTAILSFVIISSNNSSNTPDYYRSGVSWASDYFEGKTVMLRMKVNKGESKYPQEIVSFKQEERGMTPSPGKNCAQGFYTLIIKNDKEYDWNNNKYISIIGKVKTASQAKENAYGFGIKGEIIEKNITIVANEIVGYKYWKEKAQNNDKEKIAKISRRYVGDSFYVPGTFDRTRDFGEIKLTPNNENINFSFSQGPLYAEGVMAIIQDIEGKDYFCIYDLKQTSGNIDMENAFGGGRIIIYPNGSTEIILEWIGGDISNYK